MNPLHSQSCLIVAFVFAYQVIGQDIQKTIIGCISDNVTLSFDLPEKKDRTVESYIWYKQDVPGDPSFAKYTVAENRFEIYRDAQDRLLHNHKDSSQLRNLVLLNVKKSDESKYVLVINYVNVTQQTLEYLLRLSVKDVCFGKPEQVEGCAVSTCFTGEYGTLTMIYGDQAGETQTVNGYTVVRNCTSGVSIGYSCCNAAGDCEQQMLIVPEDQPEIENAAQKDSMSVITIAYIITVPGIIIICIGVNVVTYKCGVKKGRRIERKHKLQEFQEETQTVHYQHYQTDTENPEAIPLAQQGPSAGQRSVDPSHDYAAYDEIKDQRQRMQESQKRKEGGYLTPVSQGQSRALPPVRTNGDGYVSPKTTAKKSQEEVGKTSKGESPSPPGDGGYISPLQHEKDASERVGSGNSDSSSEKSDKSDKSRKYQNDPQSKASPKTKALYESLKDTGVTQEHDYIELQT